jgi:hypothetical protein
MATSQRPAATSYQQLSPPSFPLFSIYGHIRPKSALLYSNYIRTLRFDGSRLLSFESASSLPIYHNNPITSPQELCLYSAMYIRASQRLLRGFIFALRFLYLIFAYFSPLVNNHMLYAYCLCYLRYTIIYIYT